MLPNLRSLRIHVANPLFLDAHYLMGPRPDTTRAILDFVGGFEAGLNSLRYVW